MRRLPIVLLLLVLVACSGSADEPPPPDAASPTSRAPSDPGPIAPACPNEDDVAADDSLRTGNPASGDVDGDGEVDSVSVHLDPSGDPGCQAFVVAASAAAVQTAPLGTWRPDLGLATPTINALQEVDGEPGLEVVVNMGAGASAQFVGIVTEAGGELQQVTAEAGEGPLAEGLLGFGGSVGHLEAVDCAPGGGVVSSFAAPAGRAYRVERRFLAFEGAELVEDHVEVERVSLEEIDSFPEYRASPFGSCSH